MRRILAIRLLALLVVLGALRFASTQQPPAQPLTVEKLADDLHVIVGSGGNVAVLTTAEGVILVDDKFERNVPEIVQLVKGITDRPIRYILNTHHHGDHSGGNALLLPTAEIFLHTKARDNMDRTKQPGAPRVAFADELSLRLAGKEVRARHFGRGHTDGDVIIQFPAHRLIHTGDMFVAGAPFIDYSSGGSGVSWTETLNRVLALDFDRVIPGHGPVMKKEDLLAWTKSFETVRERIQKLTSEGKSREEIAKQLRIDDLAGWSGATRAWAERSLPGLLSEMAR
jgi:glyoxylase-like metal-dependent hydrolase (beta-lactamase superfamily II)